MVVIVLMLVSFALIGVILVAAIVTVQRETERSRVAKLSAQENLLPAFNFLALEPLDPRIDPAASQFYKETLGRVLVSDYLQSFSVRGVVDDVLPLRGSRRDRRDFRPPNPGPPPA
jgi:hypothetical protein